MKNIPSDVWEAKRALIARLYKNEEWPLKLVIKHVRTDDFNPSETQVRSRLKKWRVTKPSRQVRKKPQCDTQLQDLDGHTSGLGSLSPELASLSTATPTTDTRRQATSRSPEYASVSESEQQLNPDHTEQDSPCDKGAFADQHATVEDIDRVLTMAPKRAFSWVEDAAPCPISVPIDQPSNPPNLSGTPAPARCFPDNPSLLSESAIILNHASLSMPLGLYGGPEHPTSPESHVSSPRDSYTNSSPTVLTTPSEWASLSGPIDMEPSYSLQHAAVELRPISDDSSDAQPQPWPIHAYAASPPTMPPLPFGYDIDLDLDLDRHPVQSPAAEEIPNYYYSSTRAHPEPHVSGSNFMDTNHTSIHTMRCEPLAMARQSGMPAESNYAYAPTRTSKRAMALAGRLQSRSITSSRETRPFCTMCLPNSSSESEDGSQDCNYFL